MLAPDNRKLMLKALQAPEGYEFDRGIGTTFTLNLYTLLIVPLSIAMQEFADVPSALKDPVILMECLDRFAHRMSIFCQSGRISVPSAASHLFKYLEPMVVEVQAPGGGVFHPKLWLIRFVSKGQRPVYRLLNLTRNLTFDRSWDLMLSLDGELTERKRAFAQNHPLGDFVEALGGMATSTLTERTSKDIQLLGDEVRRVKFHAPVPFDDGSLQFYPTGIDGHKRLRWPKSSSRRLIVSPFLTKGLLTDLAGEGKGNVLISEAHALSSMATAELEGFQHIYVLDEMATEQPADIDPESEDIEEGPATDHRAGGPLGLHAKLFVFETVGIAEWWIGSANATDAAFRGHNVEFMVGLSGRKRAVGINKMLGSEDDASSLLSLLVPYPMDGDLEEGDAEAAAAEANANMARDALIAAELHIVVQANDDDSFNLTITPAIANTADSYEATSVRAWPITLSEKRATDALPLLGGEPIHFDGFSLLAISSFIAFELRAHAGKTVHTVRFALNLPIKGVPAGRDDRILAEILSDRERFMRFLRMILAPEAGFGWDGTKLGSGWDGRWLGSNGGLSEALLEDLVRALSRSPERIDRIADVIERLRSSGYAAGVLPEELESLWDAVIQARKMVR